MHLRKNFCLERRQQFLCEAFLRLQSPGKHCHEPCHLAEAQYDALAGHVAYMTSSIEGKEAALRGGREVYVAHNYKPAGCCGHFWLVK